MALDALASMRARPALAAPADIFNIGAPAIGSEPPKAADIKEGDASVSTQTGAFQYSFSIPVPPGRNGMQAHVGLSYSSQAPIYGGIANGWALSIPIVTLDTSKGRLLNQGTSVKSYESSMAGGRPLVAVSESRDTDVAQTYRAQSDATFTRYERLLSPGGAVPFWRARTSDGLTYQFGQLDHVGTCTIVSDEYAPLTRVVDVFGNETNYFYNAGVDDECLLSGISWGKNINAGMDDFASVAFSYSVTPATGCPTGTLIGSQTSYRTGTKIVTGASELDTITVTAYPPGVPSAPVHTRVITLSYVPPQNSGLEQTATCSATHAAYRTLYTISESAWGSDSPRVDLPPINFTYGTAQFGTGALAWSSAPHELPWSQSIERFPFNLGWGYRYDTAVGTDPTRWPTVEAMMIDVDGDGLLDRVTNAPVTDASGKLHCGAQWRRNTGNFQFENTTHPIAMPTLKWHSTYSSCADMCGGVPCVYAGGLQPSTATPNAEGCSLNYQRTNYANSSSAGGYGYCPSDDNAGCTGAPCGNGTDCSKAPTPGPTYLAFRWIDIDNDGLVDLVASPSTGSVYNLDWGTGVGDCGTPPHEPAIFGGWPPFFNNLPSCPTQSFVGDTSGLYTMCGGMYPWIIYKNHGNGQFGQSSSDPLSPVPDRILYEPIPLETSNGDSSIISNPVGEYTGTLDLDGDGFDDGVNSLYFQNRENWGLFRNDGTGQMTQSSASTAYLFGAPADEDINSTTYSSPDSQGLVSPISASGVFDLNGDGLADHWTRVDDTTANIEINDGTSFRTDVLVQGSMRPGNDGDTCPNNDCECSPTCNATKVFTWRGERYDSSRTLDVDLDGRADLVQFPFDANHDPIVNPLAYLNQGGMLASTSAGVIGDFTSLLHAIIVNNTALDGSGDDYWEVRSDMVDLDGDGIPEGVSFGTGLAPATSLTLAHVTTPALPPRLLATIDNGRGATTTVSYAAMSNTAVVEQHPELAKAMPHTQWVVQSLTSHNNVPATDTNVSTTSYYYKNPHFSADDRGLYAFRGFEEVTTTGPSGAKTVERYSYDPDWSGRLTTTLVVPAEAPSEVRSIDETTWQPHGLFNCHILNGVETCAITTYHAMQVDHWTCKNGQDEAACRANTDTFTRTVSTQNALYGVDGSGPYLWKETSARLQSSTTPSDGDRVTDSTYVLAADATNYRLLPQSVTKSVIQGGNPVMYAKTSHTFDPTNTVALTDEIWVDSVDAHRAITRREYDMTTGNVTKRWKPVQNAGDGAFAHFDYDSRKLFVSADHLEAAGSNNSSQEHDYTYEYGTGTELETQGPNIAPCHAYPQYFTSCPDGSPPKEDHRIRVDGLGRMIERYETFMNNGGSSYSSFLVETNNYFDGVGSYVVHQSAIDGGLDYQGQPVRYAQDRTDVDGLGRPTKKTIYTFGWTPTDAVTTYIYANDGTLTAVTMPDPSANDASTVTYTYAYDSLGRPTSMRRPDQSGVDMSLNGLTTTTTDHPGAGGGPAAATMATKDNFGRLIEVDEAADGSGTWATTRYAYDPADNVQTVTDPEGVTTQMVHDFAGHRTSITRASRTWSYEYDLNGNLISEIVPGFAADQHDIANFTTTIAYDDLDRPTSKVIAPRNLSLADRQLFGSDTEVFAYDTASSFGGNATGRLYYSASYAPGASTPLLEYVPTFDAQGHVQFDHRYTFGIAGLPSLDRGINRSYALGGAPIGTYHYDGVGAGSVFTYDQVGLDTRGLPYADDIIRDMYNEQQPYFAIVNTRNVAGVVTKQQPGGPYYGSPGSGGWPAIESDWTYDQLGRATSESVTVGATQVARQAVSYFGADDPATLDVTLGTNHKQLAYTFDTRHQLTGATETTTNNYFAATYGYGLAGRFSTANESTTSPPNTEVSPRDVSYVYPPTNPPASWSPGGGATRAADSEQPWSLSKSDTTIYASYDYDAVGNQVMRCLGALTYATTPDDDTCSGESWRFVYDGKDQLRRASHFSTSGALQGSEEYWYDEGGTREITVKRDSTGNVTEMIWWNGDMEAHYDPTGTVTHVYTYIHFGGITTRVDRVAETDTNIEYNFMGLGGTALAAVDQATGTVNASFSYAPFGEILEATDGGGLEGLSSHRRHWNDKFVDDISGLAYYGARFYDKTSMTWTQADPVYRFAPDARWTAPRRGNLYEFSLNNPVRYVDPDGRDVWNRAAGANWKHNNSQKGVQAAWAKERMGATTGGGEPGRSRNTNISTTALAESVPEVCVGPPGDCGSNHSSTQIPSRWATRTSDQQWSFQGAAVGALPWVSGGAGAGTTTGTVGTTITVAGAAATAVVVLPAAILVAILWPSEHVPSADDPGQGCGSYGPQGCGYPEPAKSAPKAGEGGASDGVPEPLKPEPGDPGETTDKVPPLKWPPPPPEIPEVRIRRPWWQRPPWKW